MATAGYMVTFCLDLRFHASLEGLVLNGSALNTADAMGAVVDACIALRLRRLELLRCRIVPASLPQLFRLIAAGALRELEVDNAGVAMFDGTHESTWLFWTWSERQP